MECVCTYETATIIMLPFSDEETEAWFLFQGPLTARKWPGFDLIPSIFLLQSVLLTSKSDCFSHNQGSSR